MNDLEQMLGSEIGLDPVALGPGALQRIVRLRSTALGLKSAADYAQFARQSTNEWNEFIEAVIVLETWFFRDAAAFASVARFISAEIVDKKPLRPFRILSLPCASGEEPYSLVMALTDAAIPRHLYHIDAIDISSRALAKARQAVYGRNSFRGRDLWFRQRYFRERNGEYALSPAITGQVRFSQGNLLDRNFSPAGAPYDFIFCRNLLIYFDAPGREEAIGRLESWLAPGGIIFAGPAEHSLFLLRDFDSANLPMAFACRKTASTKAGRGAARLAPMPAIAFDGVRTRSDVMPTRSSVPYSAGTASTSDSGEANHQLAEAQLLADSGRYGEAASLCERHLREAGPSAPAWHLLGTIRAAAGQPGAPECYRKALYLEPDHYASLLCLAAVLERSGDDAAARLYRARATRAKARKEIQ